jgi:hypothetical protein
MDVEDVSAVVLEFSPGLFGLYGVFNCHDKAVSLLAIGLDVFCELQNIALLQQNFSL